MELGVPLGRVDIITSIKSVSFDEAWPNHIVVELDGISVPVLGRASCCATSARWGDLTPSTILETPRVKSRIRHSFRKNRSSPSSRSLSAPWVRSSHRVCGPSPSPTRALSTSLRDQLQTCLGTAYTVAVSSAPVACRVC